MPDLTLVFMSGMPGTGKTTLALALGRICGWPVIDKDSLKSPLLTSGISDELAGPASYGLLLELAYDLLVQQHLSVILDSPGRFPYTLEKVRNMTNQVGAHLKIIRCIANRELRIQRVNKRIARPSQWNIDTNFTDEQERQVFAHFPADILTLDTSHPFEQTIEEALAYLRRVD